VEDTELAAVGDLVVDDERDFLANNFAAKPLATGPSEGLRTHER
jgi:hypothetical protein